MSSTGASAGAEAPLRIIAGPTGAGKSTLAMHLAERFGARLISADSRQVYRGFDIGTAKPTREEFARVPHEGIDVAEPGERWSAARFARDAHGWLARATGDGKPAIVVGGTGLWLRALVQPLAEEPAMDPLRRLALQEALKAMDTASLRAWVETLDPPRAHLGRAQLSRAAEVALLSGTRLSDWHAKGSGAPRRDARWLIVDPAEQLHERIARRLDQMLAAGWPDEVQALTRSVRADAPAWNACGYETIRDLVEGRVSLPEAREAVLIATRQYAKRQRTWFRNQLKDEPHVLRLDPRDPRAVERAERWFEAKGES